MDLFSAMKVFVRVVETGNFTRAAESLAMPKASATTLVQALEAHLQTKLLNRTTRRVLVTNDGAMYYERAIRVLSDVEEIDSTFKTSQGQPTGRIRVEMAGAFCDYLIIPSLHAFGEKYPDISLDIGVGDRTIDYLAENVDVALRAGAPNNQSLIIRQVAEMHFLNCASPAYLEKHGIPQTPSELENGHRILGYLRASSGKSHPFSFQRGDEVFEMEPRHQFSVSDSRSYVSAAVDGLGIIQAPRFMALQAFEKGELVPILEDWKRAALPLYVVYPPNRHLSNKVRIFVDWIIKVLGQGVV